MKFETLQLQERIKALFYQTHKEMAGSPLITKDLNEEPKWQRVSENRVAKLMKKMGLKCRSKRKFVSTTNSNHNEPIAPNILNRDFNPDAPDRVWVTDITYIKVATRWVYLTVFIDLYSRLIVGWDLSNSLSRSSVIRAFNKAWWNRRPSKGLIVHSDQGVQYASNDFRDVLEQCGAIQSMSRRGNCWDNAVAESFFHSLKTQFIYHHKFANFEEANMALYWYIEVYYNRDKNTLLTII
jgi:putative transposase